MKKYLVLSGLLLSLVAVLSGCATGMTASSWPGVITDAKNAYVAGGPYVYAVNLQTGAQVWRYPEKASPANPFYAVPVLTSDNTQLIVGGFDKKLYSLNPQTGQSIWQFTGAHDRWIGGALVVNDMVYAPSADYNLYALNLRGELQWTFNADQSIWGAPVSDGKNIYFGTLGRKVYAVNAQTGVKTWMQKLDGAILGTPVLGTDSTLYVGSYSGTVYALDAATGASRWSAAASSWIWSGAGLGGDTLFFGDGKGSLYAHAVKTSGQSWNQLLNGAIIGMPLVEGDKIVVGTEAGNVYFIDFSGKLLSTTPLPGKIYSSPVAAGDLTLIAPTGGNATLVALDPSGTTKWSFIPPK
jgi:eukaryotic-like serine/threonine-protein kinase